MAAFGRLRQLIPPVSSLSLRVRSSDPSWPTNATRLPCSQSVSQSSAIPPISSASSAPLSSARLSSARLSHAIPFSCLEKGLSKLLRPSRCCPSFLPSRFSSRLLWPGQKEAREKVLAQLPLSLSCTGQKTNKWSRRRKAKERRTKRPRKKAPFLVSPSLTLWHLFLSLSLSQLLFSDLHLVGLGNWGRPN